MRLGSWIFVGWAGAALITGCASGGVRTTAELIGHAAPEFSLAGAQGQKVSLGEFRGKVVVIDFWASWCPPCRESFPHLQALANDAAMRRAGLEVLALNEREDGETIGGFVKAGHYSVTVLRDADGAVARAYGVESIPTTLVVGRDGIVRAVSSEYTVDTARELDAAIARAMQ